MPKRDDLEYHALKIIMDKGSEGILQCDLWREMGASGRDGSRISLKLEGKNLIKREKELSDSRWTYRLFAKKRPIEIDTLLDIPCVSCPDISRCEAESEVSPNLCNELTQCLLSISK